MFIEDADNDDDCRIVIESIVQTTSGSSRRSSAPKSPGHAERVVVTAPEEQCNREADNSPEEDAGGCSGDGSDTNNDEQTNATNDSTPSPFIRADYLRRSFSLPDFADIKNSVLMNHEMDENHHRHHRMITFNPVPAHINGDGTTATQPLTYMSPKLTQSWFGGVFGCFKPIIGILSSKGFHKDKDKASQSWEIPYENLTDLQYLGCGAQGSVYVGTFLKYFSALRLQT